MDRFVGVTVVLRSAVKSGLVNRFVAVVLSVPVVCPRLRGVFSFFALFSSRYTGPALA